MTGATAGLRVVTVWHNRYEDRAGDGFTHFDGFDPARNLMTPVFVFAFEPADPSVTVEGIAGSAYQIGNADPCMFARRQDVAAAAQYRAAMLRPVSVGDVVQVDGRYLACTGGGWREVAGGDLALCIDPELTEYWAPRPEPELLDPDRVYAVLNEVIAREAAAATPALVQFRMAATGRRVKPAWLDGFLWELRDMAWQAREDAAIIAVAVVISILLFVVLPVVCYNVFG